MTVAEQTKSNKFEDFLKTRQGDDLFENPNR